MNVPVDLITAAIWAVVGLCIWIFLDSKKKYDAHLRECNERRINEGRMDATTQQRIETIEENSCQTERSVGWLGDCMIRLGTKLNIDLPDRPE